MLENIAMSELVSLALKSKPLVIDFYAKWCGPCKMFTPTFCKAAEKHEDLAEFIRIDVDAVPDAADYFGITSVPTIIILRNGEVFYRSAGSMTEPSLNALIDSLYA